MNTLVYIYILNFPTLSVAHGVIIISHVDLNLLLWILPNILSVVVVFSRYIFFQVRADGDRPCHRPRRPGVFPAPPWPSRQLCPRCRSLRLIAISRRPKGHSSGRSRRRGSATPTESRSSTTKPTTRTTRARNGSACMDSAQQMAAPSRRPLAVASRPSGPSVRTTGERPAWTTSSMDVTTVPQRQRWRPAEEIAWGPNRPTTSRPQWSRIERGLLAGVLSATWASTKDRYPHQRVRSMRNCWRWNRWTT